MSSRPAQHRLWTALGLLGELMITVGVILLLFVAYQLWWTNVMASRAAAAQGAALRDEWIAPKPADIDRSPIPKQGEAFAMLYIPRLRSRVWAEPIIQGVRPRDLSRGVGHYPGTAMPGEVGNFALAGHRATNGEPFRDIDRIKPGDNVVVETEGSWYVYELTSSRIVEPTDVWVIAADPGRSGATPTKARITLTSCHPRWASELRFIWFGVQRERISKSEGRKPAALAGGG